MSLLNDHATDHSRYWRSLNELADKPAFQDWMAREFPVAASELPPDLSRRRWLQLMGASLALGGIAGCRWEAEEFAPFTVRPQNRVPGEKQFFSTVWELGGVGRPLTVTSIDGRPTKIEGNRDHPFSGGSTDAFDQALILSLYDPDRSPGIFERTRSGPVSRSWADFDRMLADRLRSSGDGRGVAIVCEPSSSMTRQFLVNKLRASFPAVTICETRSPRDDIRDTATSLAFGEPLQSMPDFSSARVIACFDADPLGLEPSSGRHIRGWASRRDPDAEWMNRLYSFESGFSLTGSNADHRVPVRSADIAQVITRLEELVERGVTGDSSASGNEPVLRALADDLLRHRGQSILIAGPQQPAAIHARLHRLNAVLGNVGQTISYSRPASEPRVSIGALLKRLERREIETLLVLDANPAFGSPESDRFRAAAARVPMLIHAGLYRDETCSLARWHVPVAHPLESWSDARTADGTISLGQPLIAPLFDGRTSNELLAALVKGSATDSQSVVREALSGFDPRLSRDKTWRRCVHDGYVPNTACASVTPTLRDDFEARLKPTEPRRGVESDLEVVLTHSHATWDGRFANNGWLQETPDPMTKLTWDNAAVMSPRTATALKVEHGDVVRLSANGQSVELPVFELPGVAFHSIQLTLGYGRTAAGHVGGMESEGLAPVGVDVSRLQPTPVTRAVPGVSVSRTGRTRELATTQDHFAIDTTGLEAIGARVGELVRTGTLAEYQEQPDFVNHRGPHHPPLESLWEERSYDDRAWGMAIDLNRCIGCTACSVACQSENNVPIVGREQVLAGREMHWIRTDRYFAGDPDAPEVAHQPVACHHCENAPCEQVCPVAATVHSDEGLNDMVYNRCIGTRYCANNCSYKVRRFNFFDYNKDLEEPSRQLVQLSLNPEVTVRSRGVMEKCTYCVQRIQDVKITAGNERREIADGEIQTACQQACPAEAIMFGDLNDPQSAVARAHADDRAYGLLAELNTKPRTKYLARIHNPHPWLAEVGSGHQSGEVH